MLSYLNKFDTKRTVLVFALVIAAGGLLLTLVIRAGSPNASLEAESATLSGEVATVSDTQASGGSYLQFGSSGGGGGGSDPGDGGSNPDTPWPDVPEDVGLIDPSILKSVTGDFVTSSNGQVIENLEIKDGIIIVRHSVTIRNVRVHGRTAKHGGNHLIKVDADGVTVDVSNVELGPDSAWRGTLRSECGETDIVPTTALFNSDDSTLNVESAYIHHVGDGFRHNRGTTNKSYSTINYSYILLYEGIGNTDCSDHIDVVQTINGDGNITLTNSYADSRAQNISGDKGNGVLQGGDAPDGVYTIKSNYMIGGGYTLRMYNNQRDTANKDPLNPPNQPSFYITGNVVVLNSYNNGPCQYDDIGDVKEWTNNTYSDGSAWELADCSDRDVI